MNALLSRALALLAASALTTSPFAQASGQSVPLNVPEDERGLLGDIPGLTSAASAPAAPASAASAPGAGTSTPRGRAASAPARDRTKSPPVASRPSVRPGDASASGEVERAVFQLMPVRVVLPVDEERAVSLPGPFALHAPEGFEALVRSQLIERTAYLRALAAFGSLRVVAEDLATGRQIPLDLVSVPKGATPPPPMEVFVRTRDGSASPAPDTSAGADESGALDMVALTRFAAQSLYAPRRLVPATPGVRQVPVNVAPAQGLYRGWHIETVPIGAWRSGDLYVTAVRFTNTGDQPVDLDLQELRGRWLAATAQHTRLLASDPAWRTTTVYLVCDRPFDACR
jgi:integrating conjugative element protein (TIGR03749 family)